MRAASTTISSRTFIKRNIRCCIFEGETLVAMVQMLPYRMTVDGLSREATYIYGACTDPAHRRKGYMARLLERSFELDRQAGTHCVRAHSGRKVAV